MRGAPEQRTVTAQTADLAVSHQHAAAADRPLVVQSLPARRQTVRHVVRTWSRWITPFKRRASCPAAARSSASRFENGFHHLASDNAFLRDKVFIGLLMLYNFYNSAIS